MAWINTSPINKDVNTFNYADEAEKVKRQRKAAQMLQDYAERDQQGQFIKNGDFIGFAGGNTIGTTLARLASAYLSGKQGEQADALQSDLSAASSATRDHYLTSNPAADRARQGQVDAESAAEMLRESRRGPVGVQGDPAAESFPVAPPGQVETTPLAPVNPKAASAALAQPNVGGAGGSWDEPDQQVVGGGGTIAQPSRRGAMPRQGYFTGQDAGGGRGFVNPPSVDMSQPAPVDPAAAAAVVRGQPAPATQPQPTLPATPAAEPPNVAQAMSVGPAPQDGPYQPVGDSRSAVEQAGANARQTPQDQLKQIDGLMRSGPLGQTIGQTMLSQMFGPKAGGYEFKAVKQGDNEVLVAVNQRDPRDTKVVWQSGQGGSKSVAERTLELNEKKYADEQAQKTRERDATVAQATRRSADLTKEIDSVLESKMPEDASGKAGTAGAWLNKATGGIVKTDGSNARAYIDGLGDKFIQQAIAQMSAQGVSATQLANTETEAQRLMRSMLNLDYNRMDATQIREQLAKARAGVQALVQDAVSKGGQGPASAPSTFNGLPAYQRGQTIRPQ
jgi:hypothetical protein